MSRNRIGRRIYETKCQVMYADVNNDLQEMEVLLYGEFDQKHAQLACERALDNKRVIVQSFSTESYYASMPIETFVKYADKKE